MPESSSSPKLTLIYDATKKGSLRFLFLFLTTILPLALFILALLFRHPPLTSPLSSTNLLHFPPTPKPAKLVFGFLPYWNFKFHSDIPFQHLTHLGIFGLALNPDGTIQTREKNYPEPGYRALTLDTFNQIRTQAQSTNTKLILVLRGFDNQTIDSIIKDPTHTHQAITSTLNFARQNQFDGINLDFEYTGTPDPSTINAFTEFVASFSAALRRQQPPLEFSLDVFADSSASPRIWDLENLHPYLDYLVIMAYDFHRPNSPVAGPIAPIFGAGSLWSHDITTLLMLHLKKTPPSKILLGVPYYGYQWRTIDTSHQSQTFPRSGSLASLKRIQTIINTQNPQLNWNSFSLSPWLYWQQDDQIHQIYYENYQSLALKYDLVNQTNLAGIAIWALGYEPPHSRLWQLIPQKFK